MMSKNAHTGQVRVAASRLAKGHPR